jgi:hypothetical protein
MSGGFAAQTAQAAVIGLDNQAVGSLLSGIEIQADQGIPFVNPTGWELPPRCTKMIAPHPGYSQIRCIHGEVVGRCGKAGIHGRQMNSADWTAWHDFCLNHFVDVSHESGVLVRAGRAFIRRVSHRPNSGVMP